MHQEFMPMPAGRPFPARSTALLSARSPGPATNRVARVGRCAAAVFITVLAACGAPGPVTDGGPDTAGVATAAAAFGRGSYVEAATAWQREALDAAPREAASLRVRAADAWLLADRASEAEDVLRWVSRDDLSPADRARLDLVLADLAHNNRPDEAEPCSRRPKAHCPQAPDNATGNSPRAHGSSWRALAPGPSRGRRGPSRTCRTTTRRRPCN
jgi:hypothetical protein